MISKSRQFFSGNLVAGKVHDLEIQKLFVKCLRRKNNAVFVDIDANIGYFTATASALGERTISYEAFYENAGVIMSTIEKNIWRNQSTLHMNMLGYKANCVTIESTNVGINLSNMQIIGIQCASKMPNAGGGIWT